jgi:glycosyltransferase involved in cell wall biosynthesis
LGRAPSQRFRWEQYVEPLRRNGISLEPSSFLDDRGVDVAHAPGEWAGKTATIAAGFGRRLWDALVARRHDLVLVHRESSPVGPAWVEWWLRAAGVPYVFDFDDAIYLSAASAANRRFAQLKSPRKVVNVVRGAQRVLAGNSHLAEWASAYSASVDVIPTTIDTDIYQPVTRPYTGTVCIGWSGSPSTIEHLRLLEPVLLDLQRERGITIRVIGDSSYKLDGAIIDAMDWNAHTELGDLSPIDIGVMPLPDDEWSRGKCGLKALQYMALGIPTVLSPVGVNCEIARDGAAVLAGSHAEWGEALRALIDDPDLRTRFGDAGRTRVETEYSVHAMLSHWECALRDAAERSEARLGSSQ